MNIVFVALTLVSLVILCIFSPTTAFSTMIGGVSNAIILALKLCAIYAVWLSVLKMAQAIRADRALSRMLKPVVKKIFKHESDEAYNWICVNLASNMLGMGGVATPAGIKAIDSMEQADDKASANMIMLLVINATSIQLIPATVIAIRASANSQNPADIFVPTLLSSIIATACGMILCKVLSLTDNGINYKTKSLYMQNDNKKSCFCINKKPISKKKHL